MIKPTGDPSESQLSLQIMFNFDTFLEQYGLMLRLEMKTDFMEAELYTKFTVGAKCTEDSVRESINGKVTFEIPGATEALATLHGYKDCYVKNATKPAVHIVGGMYEIRLNVGDFAFVVNHLEIELNGYKARRDTEEMIDDVDYETLSYHVKVKGSLSFLHTSAIPMMPNARADATINYFWNAVDSEFGDILVDFYVDAKYQPDESMPPVVAISGTASLVWPCTYGRAVTFGANFTLNLAEIAIEGGAVQA